MFNWTDYIYQDNWHSMDVPCLTEMSFSSAISQILMHTQHVLGSATCCMYNFDPSTLDPTTMDDALN